MDDFEEKLNAILSSPETMGQIMALANSLTGNTGNPEEQPASEGGCPSPAPTPQTGSGEFNPLSLLQGLDPSMLSTLSRLFQEYSRGEDERAALLAALKPFLRPERQEKVEKAMQITRISRVIREAMRLFREEGHV